MASANAMRAESVEPRGDAVSKLLNLKRALSAARTALLEQGVRTEDATLRHSLSELADDVKRWDEALEDLRTELAHLIGERDRWRISHDKLRERLDHHSLQPRTGGPVARSSAQIPAVRATAPPADGQDFSAIDRELEQLNASMMRAFTSE